MSYTLPDSMTFSYSGRSSSSSDSDVDNIIIEVCKWRRNKHLTSNNLHLADILATDSNIPHLIGFRTGSDSQLTDGVSPAMSAESSDENKENDVGSKSKKKDSTNRSIWYITSDRVSAALSESLSPVTSTISDHDHEHTERNDHEHTERKVTRTKPKGTIEIEVPLNGTLNSIAAHYDTTPSELMKLNKLGSRMVFPGQMLLIPDPDYVTSSEPSSPDLPPSPVFRPPVHDRPRVDIPIVKLADKSPAKVPGHVERQMTPVSSPQDKKQFDLTAHTHTEEEVHSLDHECYERFIKINVKHITDGQISRDAQGNTFLGVVNGTLLVTPNAVMFDPNVSDPLVIEHGSEKYGMITPMDMVISAAMYHDIAAMRMRGRKDEDQTPAPKHEIYHSKDCPLHHSGSVVYHGDIHADYVDSTIKHSSTADSLSSTTTACSCGALSREQSISIEADDAFEKHSYFTEEIRNQICLSRVDSIKTNVVDSAEGYNSLALNVDVKPLDLTSADQSVRDSSQSVNGVRSDGADPLDDGVEQFANSAVPSANSAKLSTDSPGPFSNSTGPSANSAGLSEDDYGPFVNRVDLSENSAGPSENSAGPSANSAGPSANSAGPSANSAGSSANCAIPSVDGAEHFKDDAVISTDSVGPSADRFSGVNLSSDSNTCKTDTNISGVCDENLGVDNVFVDDGNVTELVGGPHSDSTDDNMGGMISEISGPGNEITRDSGLNSGKHDMNFQTVDRNANTEITVANPNRNEAEIVSFESSETQLNESESSRKTPANLTLSVASNKSPAQFSVSQETMTTMIKRLNLPNTSLGKVKSENGNSGESRIGNIVYLPVEENGNGEMVIKGTNSPSFGDVDNQPTSSPSVQSAAGTDSNVGVRAIKSSAQHLSSFVNYATGLFRSNIDDRLNVKDISEVLVTSAPTHAAADNPIMVMSSTPKGFHHFEVSNAIRLEDKPELFQTFDKLIARPATHVEDPPLYLCLRVGNPKNKEVSQTCPIESYRSNKKKPEYWFSIPRAKVDALYAFFVQWTPDIYGDEEEIDPETRGFVVIDEDDDTPEENLEIIDEHFAKIQKIRKDWEIISKWEALRRMSTVDEDYSILPELAGETKLLSEDHIRELSINLPPRTIGYTWTLIYSTELNGFSLKTLYRFMHGIDSPILLVVTDTSQHVFGAITSCALKMSDHFYGTGESFLFTFYPEFKVFHWTGENNFFLKGNQESLAIGAGQGLFGLWFDGDLYHGRSHKCETFDNDVLTDTEDFVVKGLEAWAFI